MPIDILLDENFDPIINAVTGEFIVGQSTRQHQKLLLLCDKGDFVEDGLKGVGLFGFLDDENPANMYREIRVQFNQDGMSVNRLDMINKKLQVDAPYNENA
jgi:hypothetical protein